MRRMWGSMKDVLVPVSVPLAPRAMHDRLYAGEVLHFDGLPQMGDIVALTRSFLEDAFLLDDPTEMHRHLTNAEFAEVARSRSREYGRLGEVKRLWRAMFEAVGLDPAELARDRLFLRFQPPEDAGRRLRGVSTAGFHRDTWGTNLYAQVNWWAPVYPITAGRTVALYPTLWSRPVANTSAEFDITAAIAGDRQAGQSAPAEMVPRPTEDVSAEPAVPVVIAPGTVITFSSAHAHAGVPNHTGVTRISLETRTLWIPDVLSGAGAPNLDGDAPLMSPGLFRRVSDEAKLDELLGMQKVETYPR
jgi:hypothetical protein